MCYIILLLHVLVEHENNSMSIEQSIEDSILHLYSERKKMNTRTPICYPARDNIGNSHVIKSVSKCIYILVFIL